MATDGVLISSDGDAFTVSDDGKALVVYDPSCVTACCGDACARIRRYTRCAPTPLIAGCQSEPDHLWVCDYPDGSVPPMPETFKYLNACYSRTQTVIDTAKMPAGDVLLLYPSPNLPLGCADPDCTACQRFYLAEPCPGENVSGLPHVYVRVEIVPTPGPGEDCAGVSVEWPDRGRICYTVKPGPMYTRPEVEASGGFIHPAYQPLALGFKCCVCVVGCAETVVPTYTDCGLGDRLINLRCCCSDEWTATVTITATVTVDGGPGTAIQTDTISGSIAQGNPAPVPVQTFTKRTYRPPFGSDPGFDSGPQPITPPGVNHCPPALLGATGNNDDFPWYAWLAQNANMTRCPVGGPFTITGPTGDRDEVVRADTYLTCNSFSLNYLHRFWAADQPGSPRIETSIVLTVTIRHTGRCGGGCGQASGQALDPSGRLVAGLQASAERATMLAVPRKDWPRLVAWVARRQADGDMGVGDTIARIVGPKGGDRFKAVFKQLTGHDCGCADRQAWLNARYPYGADG